jgi:hypothetical protein
MLCVEPDAMSQSERKSWRGVSFASFAMKYKCVSMLVCLATVLPGWGTAVASTKLRKTEIAPFTRNLDTAAISPDGSLVAILRTTEGGSVDHIDGPLMPGMSLHTVFTFENQLEVRDVATSALRTTVALPTVREPESMSGFSFLFHSHIQYCDHGKYLLAYGEGGTFFVLDGDTYEQKFTIVFDKDKYPVGVKRERGSVLVVTASACSANANIAAIELLFGPYGTGVTKVFDLDTGKQIEDITEDISPGRLMNIDVSPSGASAVIAVERPSVDKPPAKNDDLVILDLQSGAVSRRILTGIDLLQAVFVGESSVATASGDGVILKAKPSVLLFDIHSGAVTNRVADPENGANGEVAASADGRFLLAYTGKENHCEHCQNEEHRGQLQIEDARFTIWDLSTGNVVVRSPHIPVAHGGTLSFTTYWRPVFQISQSGNAVLVTQITGSEPIDVYSLQ